MTFSQARSLFTLTYQRWSRHNAQRLGAALAYYALLSVSPLLIVLTGICGLVFNHNSAEHNVLLETQQMMGTRAAQAMQALIEDTHQRGTGILATVIAIATLFVGASGVFSELHSSLNEIWEAPPRNTGGWRTMLSDRILAFAMILGLGVFLLASFLITAGLSAVQKFVAAYVSLPVAAAAEAVNLGISLVTLSFLFGLVYRFVPNVRIAWRDVSVGATVTTVLFIAGKYLLAIYLTTAAVGSMYGAAGSLVAFVAWVYYSAQIFFFGAVFTRVYAERVSQQRIGRNATRAAIAERA